VLVSFFYRATRKSEAILLETYQQLHLFFFSKCKHCFSHGLQSY